VAAELCPDLARYESDAPLTETVEGLLGTHPRIHGRRLIIRIDELIARTRAFRARQVPEHRAYQHRRTALVAAERARIRLDEYRPRVMSAFVRSRLIDEVYLPLVGDSLAKQLGTTGESKRTDTGGLLLLISPPRYGKTTLMEYVADRLGLLLGKVNGPALGHSVTSLDPAEAPNATARREIEKIHFAPEAGSNTLLHLDDIQHTSPELLQTFIPLCDATRRIEGVRDGEPRTYHLRGKRFAVCTADNPYTESGSRFRVPDMLANRADVRNLGDVLTGRDDAYALSFVENALTSNPVLAPLAGRDRAGINLLIRLAQGDSTARGDRLNHPCSQDGSGGERRAHRLGSPVRHHADGTALPTPGLPPQHEQDHPAHPAGHERRRTGRPGRRPLLGRGPDPHHRRRGQPPETGRAARHAHHRTGGALGHVESDLRARVRSRRPGRRPPHPGR
jgi:hypothetical protein